MFVRKTVILSYLVPTPQNVNNIPYGSESVWKGCVFPRPAAPAVHATLPNDF